MKRITASYDLKVLIITAIVVLAYLYAIINIIYPIFRNSEIQVSVTDWIIMIGGFVILLCAFLLSVKCYYLTENKIIIKKQIGKKQINLDEIENLREFSINERFKSVRKIGVSGFFGYYGKYFNLTVGNYDMYCTNTKHLLLIKTKKGNFVISPDDTELFRKFIKQ